jgi:hypothetical protein
MIVCHLPAHEISLTAIDSVKLVLSMALEPLGSNSPWHCSCIRPSPTSASDSKHRIHNIMPASLYSSGLAWAMPIK